MPGSRLEKVVLKKRSFLDGQAAGKLAASAPVIPRLIKGIKERGVWVKSDALIN